MYCNFCGKPLILKEDGIDGMVPFCTSCEKFIYPTFNVASSAIVMNKDNMILLIKQYGKDGFILTAGYVTKGESAEECIKREVKEELNLEVVKTQINQTKYFEKSNTLMINFTVWVEKTDYLLNDEVDCAKWFTINEALKEIRKGSLAEEFLANYLAKQKLV